MTLKRVQTAQSSSPAPGPRARRPAAGTSRLHADEYTTASSSVDDTNSKLETLDSSYPDFQQQGDASHSQHDEPVYYDDDNNSQFDEDVDNRARSVTVMNDREGSAFPSAARERSHTAVPTKPNSNNSTTHASSYSQNNAQRPDTTMHGDNSGSGDPEDLMDLADKARFVLFTVEPDS